MLATVLLWPVAALIRKRYGRPLPLSPRDRRLFRFSRIVCLLEISCIALVGLPMSLVETDVSYLGDGLNPWLIASRLTGWLAALGLIVLAMAAVRFWKITDLGWWPRVHATLLLLASVAFISFAWWGHLLTPSLKFSRENGAEDGTRTRDLLITNQLLYQLSYFGQTAETPGNMPSMRQAELGPRR